MKKCSNDFISVVMGVCYRNEDTRPLEISIQSILNQTYENFEFVICENGSSEKAKAVLAEYKEKDKRIKLLDGFGADSLAKKLNICINASSGQFIARQDDDDISKPERFSKQIEYLKKHDEIAFVGCSVEIKQGDKIMGTRNLPNKPEIKDFLFVQPFIHPTLLFRREYLDNVGLYCEHNRCNGCEDYDLLLRLYEKNQKGHNLTEPYFIYTIYKGNSGNRNFKMRINEVKTRFVRFRSLNLLPKALPYVIKPIVVGLIPNTILNKLKSIRSDTAIK